ncbi:TPA: hypothetical protein ACKPZB_000045 [Serratia marcescens]
MTFEDFAKQAYANNVKNITVEYLTYKQGNRDGKGDETVAVFKDQNGKVLAKTTVAKK